MGTEQWPLFNQYCPVTSWEGRPASGLWPTFHGKHRDQAEFWEVHVKSKQNRSGMHCIAPGCTNHFYKKQEKVHYHRLPVANKELLRKWLQKMKRANPPVNCNSCVCSNHFLPEDYVLTEYFNELGEYREQGTNRLMPEAVLSVFEFFQYSFSIDLLYV